MRIAVNPLLRRCYLRPARRTAGPGQRDAPRTADGAPAGSAGRRQEPRSTCHNGISRQTTGQPDARRSLRTLDARGAGASMAATTRSGRTSTASAPARASRRRSCGASTAITPLPSPAGRVTSRATSPAGCAGRPMWMTRAANRAASRRARSSSGPATTRAKPSPSRSSKRHRPCGPSTQGCGRQLPTSSRPPRNRRRSGRRGASAPAASGRTRPAQGQSGRSGYPPDSRQHHPPQRRSAVLSPGHRPAGDDGQPDDTPHVVPAFGLVAVQQSVRRRRRAAPPPASS